MRQENKREWLKSALPIITPDPAIAVPIKEFGSPLSIIMISYSLTRGISHCSVDRERETRCEYKDEVLEINMTKDDYSEFADFIRASYSEVVGPLVHNSPRE